MVLRTPRRPTAKDVAARAGVSASTASRALSGQGYVSAPARERIEAAVLALGYVPDANARNLRLGAGRDVGVMVTNLRNSFYSELATAIESRLRDLGYNMILATDNGEETEQLAVIDRLISMRVAGIILTPVSSGAVERVGIRNPDSITPRRRNTRGSGRRASPGGKHAADRPARRSGRRPAVEPGRQHGGVAAGCSARHRSGASGQDGPDRG